MPESFRTYKQVYKCTWDIETFERKHERDNENDSVELINSTVTNAILRPVSIGVSSNMPGFENRFFCRKSSSLEDGEEMVHEFMDYLFKMAENLQKLIPKEIHDAAKKLAKKIDGQTFSKAFCQERGLLYHLNNYRKLSVYGFNSGKILFLISILLKLSARFDVPVMIGMISKWCKDNQVKMSTIKKGSGYMVLEMKDGDLIISAKDTRHYSSPCNLDKFLKTWKAPAEKSIFPYQKFSSIEECEATIEFPPIEDFYNDLKQVYIFLYI